MFIDFVPNYGEDLNIIGNGEEENFGSMCKLARAVTSLQSIFFAIFYAWFKVDTIAHNLYLSDKFLLIQRLCYTKWVVHFKEKLVTCLFFVTIQCFDINDKKNDKYPIYYDYKTF